jgi:hypothetical protein
MSDDWYAQLSGHAAVELGALDLVNFERHRALLRFGYDFFYGVSARGDAEREQQPDEVTGSFRLDR